MPEPNVVNEFYPFDILNVPSFVSLKDFNAFINFFGFILIISIERNYFFIIFFVIILILEIGRQG